MQVDNKLGKMSGAADKLSSTKTPADFLKSIRGRPVVVKLNSGVDYRGEFHPIITRPPLHFPLVRRVCLHPLVSASFSFHYLRLTL